MQNLLELRKQAWRIAQRRLLMLSQGVFESSTRNHQTDYNEIDDASSHHTLGIRNQ